jgi:hypothetical protein
VERHCGNVDRPVQQPKKGLDIPTPFLTDRINISEVIQYFAKSSDPPAPRFDLPLAELPLVFSCRLDSFQNFGRILL